MKIAFLGLGVVVWMFSILSAIATSQTDTELANQFYPKFANKTDGTGTIIRNSQFVHSVPETDQAEVLAIILDRAINSTPKNDEVIAEIIWLMTTEFGDKVVWNIRLEKLTYAQIKNPNKNVRVHLIELLAKRQKDKARDVVLPFLQDSDQAIRDTTIHSISSWPDAKSIYQKFIQDHRADPHYAESVDNAETYLKVLKSN